ncbi:MAG: endonuclease/exonuclease/phosphatase family protein [Verrucomicrobia bacterium]|nr:endonuclease/exonuclease/phosphatase family protein [Verrucomicrobiota bacterium]
MIWDLHVKWASAIWHLLNRGRRREAMLILGCWGLVELGAMAGQVFTVGTYNVLYRNPQLPKVAAAIRQMNADLVALQETTPEAEKFLRRELAVDFPYMRFREGEKNSDGFGFLSKLPLENLQFIEPLPGWRGCWLAQVSLGGSNVQVASVHLATPRPRDMASWSSIFLAFQTAEETHTKEMARINAQLSSRLPVILLGDFNSFSFSVAPQFLIGHRYVDSFASVTTNADQQGTWRLHPNGNEPALRIDFIFHSPHIRTLESRIIQSKASDHLPVVSKLSWRAP